MQAEKKEKAKPEAAKIVYVTTSNLAELFRQLKISLLVSTYQAGRVLLFTASGETKISMLMRRLPRPTGLALGKSFLAVAAKHQIWFFAGMKNIPNKDPKLAPHDLTLVPRHSQITGGIDLHEMEWHQGKLIGVNTLYSCLSIFEHSSSFVPIWKPKFVTDLVPEDRCHLNGLCLDENGVKYVSALGETNVRGGWREKKADGGILIDVPSGEIVARGFSMPHSPRIYAGRVWLLDSGTASLLLIDPKTGKKDVVHRFQGFLRGLAFHGNYAFVGVCRAREKKVFGSLPIEKEFKEFLCGISVVNLTSGQQEAFIHFKSGVEELFSVVVLPGYTNPYMIGFEGDEIVQTRAIGKLLNN